MASRIVRSRAGASRGPPDRSGNRRSRRASNAAGGSTLTRAAASSMASGNPSRRRQISATAGAVSPVRANSACAACARSTKSRTASARQRLVRRRRRVAVRQPEGRNGVLALAGEAEPDPAGRQDRQPRAGGEQVGDVRSGLDHLFDVVQDEQQALAAHGRPQPRGERFAAGRPDAEGRRHGRHDQVGGRDGGERDEPDAVREGCFDRRGGRDREPGLAHPAGTGQRQQADGRIGEQPTEGFHLAFPADERGRRHRQRSTTVGLLRPLRGDRPGRGPPRRGEQLARSGGAGASASRSRARVSLRGGPLDPPAPGR
jgi:hypothetical protein